MKMSTLFGPALGALAVVCLLGVQPVQATTQIALLDSLGNIVPPPNGEVNPASPTHTDATDYSDTGLDIGNDGFLFFNFGQTAPTSSTWPNPDVASQNAVVSLPSWISVDFDPTSPTYSFADDPGVEGFTKGGQPDWADLTLPDGTSGRSGALVDPGSEDNSDNAVKEVIIGAGAPPALIMHIVTDNTNQEHDPAGRLRAREDASGLSVKASSLTFNSEPDVYSFLYTGLAVGDNIKIQLNSGVAGESGSIAGLMFDAIPEPSSLLLLALGAATLVGATRRRR